MNRDESINRYLSAICEAAKAAEALEGLGAPVSDPRVLARLESNLLNGGQPLSSVEYGNSAFVVPWIENKQRLKHALGTALRPLGTNVLSSIAEARQTIKKQIVTQNPVYLAELGTAQSIRMGLVQVGRLPSSFLDPTYRYVSVGPEWAVVAAEIRKLDMKLGDAATQCILSGRVLVFTNQLGALRLEPPSRLEASDLSRLYRKGTKYLLACELPHAILSTKGGPRSREDHLALSEARTVCEALYEALVKSGKRATQDQFNTITNKRFGLSREGFRREVWMKFERTAWKNLGAIPTAESISDTELASLFDTIS